MHFPSQNRKHISPTKSNGFTLIELLIVVAIIAVLAAIAVPNFLEAQTRAKVSRTKADLRTLATALESYVVDQNSYPFDGLPGTVHYGWFDALKQVTSPISYVSSLPADVFQDTDIPAALRTGHSNMINGPSGDRHTYDYATAFWQNLENNPADKVRWLANFGNSAWKLTSAGPDLSFTNPGSFYGFASIYDASNGTVSAGDIVRSAANTDSK